MPKLQKCTALCEITGTRTAHTGAQETDAQKKRQDPATAQRAHSITAIIFR
jgi:hypothetical protein